MKGVFSALAYLHDELNFIHRDLKPGNILVNDDSSLTTNILQNIIPQEQSNISQINKFIATSGQEKLKKKRKLK